MVTKGGYSRGTHEAVPAALNVVPVAPQIAAIYSTSGGGAGGGE